MAELFGVDVRTVNYHLKEIYNSKELTEESTIRKIRIVQQEGKRNVERELDFYHLKAILAVGYRVNSSEGYGIVAIQISHWGTVLDDYPELNRLTLQTKYEDGRENDKGSTDERRAGDAGVQTG